MQRSQRANAKTDQAADARAILALLSEPPKPRVERSLSGLAYEVRNEFAEAQRKAHWGR